MKLGPVLVKELGFQSTSDCVDFPKGFPPTSKETEHFVLFPIRHVSLCCWMCNQINKDTG